MAASKDTLFRLGPGLSCAGVVGHPTSNRAQGEVTQGETEAEGIDMAAMLSNIYRCQSTKFGSQNSNQP